MADVEAARQVAIACVPLRQHRLRTRKPFVAVGADTLEVHLPGTFTARPGWRIPLADVVVVDPAGLGAAGPAEPTWTVFVDAVTVPYLASTSAAAPPNLQLLFRLPVHLPRLRLVRGLRLGFAGGPAGKAGLRGGTLVDGVGLRAVEPRSAVEVLVAAGVERVVDPVHWLVAHRATTTDPRAVEAVEAVERRRRLGRIAAPALLALLVATAWWAQRSASGWGAGAVGVECVAGLAVLTLGRRRGRA